MSIRECPIHQTQLEVVPAAPIARCPNCHSMRHSLQFGHCPECGRRMQIEEPEPRQRCPICEAAQQDPMTSPG
jgi:hypothetical protein